MSTPDIIRIDKTFTYGYRAGRVTLYKNRQVIVESHYQAAKAIIAAVCELEAHRQDHLDFAGLGEQFNIQALGLGTEMPLDVLIENGKYSYRCTQAGAFNVANPHLRRHGAAWIDTDELEQKAFWFALATALHNARRYTAALVELAQSTNTELGFTLESSEYAN